MDERDVGEMKNKASSVYLNWDLAELRYKLSISDQFRACRSLHSLGLGLGVEAKYQIMS